jgi:hypothetical protein
MFRGTFSAVSHNNKLKQTSSGPNGIITGVELVQTHVDNGSLTIAMRLIAANNNFSGLNYCWLELISRRGRGNLTEPHY